LLNVQFGRLNLLFEEICQNLISYGTQYQNPINVHKHGFPMALNMPSYWIFCFDMRCLYLFCTAFNSLECQNKEFFNQIHKTWMRDCEIGRMYAFLRGLKILKKIQTRLLSCYKRSQNSY